jgi:hypothetical protein
MVPSGNMGRRKQDGNHSAAQNKSVQDSEGNEENRYTDSDSKKTKINQYQGTQQSPQ